MIHLPGVLAAASEVQRFCLDQGWHFCFIGGVAVQRWGEPRLTQDVDVTVLTALGDEASVADSFLQRFRSRRSDARAFALQHRVLLLRTDSGVDVDVAFGGLPFEARTIQRASPWPWDGETAITTCSAEDLVVHKVFAGRDLDWGDVERILTRQHGKLNLAQIRDELRPLLELKEEPEALARFDQKVASVDRRLHRR